MSVATHGFVPVHEAAANKAHRAAKPGFEEPPNRNSSWLVAPVAPCTPHAAIGLPVRTVESERARQKERAARGPREKQLSSQVHIQLPPWSPSATIPHPGHLQRSFKGPSATNISMRAKSTHFPRSSTLGGMEKDAFALNNDQGLWFLDDYQEDLNPGKGE